MFEYDIEYLERVKDLTGKLNCYLDEKITERLLTAYMLEEDPLQKSGLRNEIDTLLGAYTPLLFSDKPLLRSPTLDESKGDVVFGKITQGSRKLHPFSLYLNEFTRHIGIYGQTGHGKTSFLYSLIDQLIELKIPFLYFDLKRDGRCLLRQQESLIVIPWRQLRWNPLRNPPGMDVKLWWQLFAEVCGHVWGVYHAGVNYLLEYLDRLYEKYKKGGRFPTLQDLYEMMLKAEEKSRKRLDYFDVMYNRVRTLISVLGPVINVETGFRLEDMLNRPVILEIDQLRTDDQTFIVELMMTWIYAFRLVQGHRTEKLRHCIIVDEGHRIFDVNKEFRETTREMGRPPIDIFPTQFRDFGESLIITSQEPSLITNSLHANTLLKISGNLGSGRDIAAISEAMNLTEEETSCIPKLQRGEWIVRLSDRYTRPFIITTPYHPMDKDVSDDEVIARAKPYLSQFKETVAGSKQTDPTVLSDDAHSLLLNVNRYPLMHLTNRYKALGIIGKRGENAKSELIQKKLVEVHEIPIGSFRPVKYLVPTASGREFLKSKGQRTGHWKAVGHVGFDHMLYQKLIAFYLSKMDHPIILEKDLGNGRRVDIFATIDDKRVGIEIAQNSNVDVWQLLKAQQNLDELLIVCKDRNVLEKLEERIRKVAYPSVLSKIRFYLVTKYLSKLRCDVRARKLAKKSNYSKNPDSGLIQDKKAEKEGKS